MILNERVQDSLEVYERLTNRKATHIRQALVRLGTQGAVEHAVMHASTNEKSVFAANDHLDWCYEQIVLDFKHLFDDKVIVQAHRTLANVIEAKMKEDQDAA
jgi:hypothetical protein